MGWFHMYLSWILASAVSVSCQELTTLLPQDDDACMRNEVTFTCTIRGSRNLTSLILAWSSTEYIGNGKVLRFLSDDMPENNKTSTINENVTAILTINAMINGVPALVSVLRVIGANQRSTIKCESVTNGSSASTEFISSAYPGRPQNGEARERSAGNCDFLVTWDPPASIGRFDIDRYIIYVPLRSMMNISFSTTIGLTIPNCRVGNNSIQVAAVNRLGCVGPNSSYIQLSLLEIPSQTDGPSAPVGGIVAGVVGFFIVCLIIVLVISCSAWKAYKQKHESDEQERKKRESDKENFISNLSNLYSILKWNQTSSIQEAAIKLLRLMKEIPSTDVKEALKTVLETKFTSAEEIWNALVQLKLKIPAVIRVFDTKLEEVGSVTVSNLITAARDNEHEEPLDELKKQVDKASPEDVKDHLQKLFKALKGDSSDSDEEAFHGYPHRAQDGHTVPCTT